MDEIEAQSEYYFIFNQNQIDVNRIVKIENYNRKVQEILPDLFEGTNVNYTLIDKKILLTPKTTEDSLKSTTADKNQQQITVSGTVTDASTLEPMAGVNVQVKGTIVGAVTNEAGEYTLVVPDRNTVLIFSFIGYTTGEVPVQGRSIVNFALEAEISGLDEVIVIGYGTQRRADLTGSISTVSTEELDASPTFNLEQSIKGRSSGVVVTANDGTPGANISIRIRGDNSIIGSNEPLYVVDGVPITGGIDYLNPSDIASMTILKDASSTAIYGSRGANGVIVITTIKGQKNTTGRIELNSYYGVQSAAKRYYSLNAQQWAICSNEWLKNEGQEPYFSQSDIDALGEGTDWWAEFIKPAPVQNHTLNFTGGTDKMTYSWSVNYFEQGGLMINSNAQRANTRLNLTHEVNNRVKLGLN